MKGRLFSLLVMLSSVVFFVGCGVGDPFGSESLYKQETSKAEDIRIPKKLDNKGMLIFGAVTQWSVFESELYKKRPVFFEISGRRYKVERKNRISSTFPASDFISVPLPPGKHKLREIYYYSREKQTVYNSGTTERFKFLDVNMEFDIKPGSITNLGIVFINYKNNKVFLVDNSREVRQYIKISLPPAYNSAPLLLAKPRKAYFYPAEVLKLKKSFQDYHVKELEQYKHIRGVKPGVLCGELGLLGYRAKFNGPVQFFNTGTVAQIFQCAHGRNLTVGISDAGRLHIHNSRTRRVSTASLPAYQPLKITSERMVVDQNDKIYFVTDDFTVFYSSNMGKSWDHLSDISKKNKRCIFIEVVQNARGTYFYCEDWDSYSHGGMAYFPAKHKKPLLSKSVPHPKPANCTRVNFSEEGDVTISCSGGTKYLSRDHGRSWLRQK